MKKKTAIILLLLIAVFALTSCDLLISALTPAGTWYRYNGGYYYTLVLNTDGTGTYYRSSSYYTTSSSYIYSRFTWSYDSTFIYFYEYSGYSRLDSYYWMDHTSTRLTLDSMVFRSSPY